MQAQPTLHLCRVPEKLNLSGLDLESACKPKPTSGISWQTNLEAEHCRLGNHTHREWGQTQCGQATALSTPTHGSDILFAVFLPLQSMTEQVSAKQVTTSAPLYQGRNQTLK